MANTSIKQRPAGRRTIPRASCRRRLTKAEADVDSVQSFERGMAVIRSFGHATPQQTVADVAAVTDLSRATARRLLHTLELAGYARRIGTQFELTARVLELGYAYMSSLTLAQLADPHLHTLSRAVGESTSIAVLDGPWVVYVARVQANRLMTVSIGIGTRFPAHQTSLGRAQLAWLPDDRVATLWGQADHSRQTSHTVRMLDDLRAELAIVRDRGWSLLDQELELGVRSVAAPIRDTSGHVVAAVNVSTHATRTSLEDVESTIVPALVVAATEIQQSLCLAAGAVAQRAPA